MFVFYSSVELVARRLCAPFLILSQTPKYSGGREEPRSHCQASSEPVAVAVAVVVALAERHQARMGGMEMMRRQRKGGTTTRQLRPSCGGTTLRRRYHMMVYVREYGERGWTLSGLCG